MKKLLVFYKNNKLPVILFLVTVVLWGLYYPVIKFWFGNDLDARGVFGDAFGALNTLFSGLAFVLLIFSIRQQNRSIEQQRQSIEQQSEMIRLNKEELEATREELAKSAKAHETQVRIMEEQNRIKYMPIFKCDFDSNIYYDTYTLYITLNNENSALKLYMTSLYIFSSNLFTISDSLNSIELTSSKVYSLASVNTMTLGNTYSIILNSRNLPDRVYCNLEFMDILGNSYFQVVEFQKSDMNRIHYRAIMQKPIPLIQNEKNEVFKSIFDELLNDSISIKETKEALVDIGSIIFNQKRSFNY